MFQIQLTNYVNLIPTLSERWNLPPSELDRLTFWEYQLIVQRIIEIVEIENGNKSKESEKQQESTSKMLQQSRRSMKAPKMKAPKFRR